jgi:hypothetical protein
MPQLCPWPCHGQHTLASAPLECIHFAHLRVATSSLWHLVCLCVRCRSSKWIRSISADGRPCALHGTTRKTRLARLCVCSCTRPDSFSIAWPGISSLDACSSLFFLRACLMGKPCPPAAGRLRPPRSLTLLLICLLSSSSQLSKRERKTSLNVYMHHVHA